MPPHPLRFSLVLLAATVARGAISVTEVMYDPASDENTWEWIEVKNTGAAAVDLDGYVIDRVGDRERSDARPNVLGRPTLGSEEVTNPTVLPPGGIAVLYNGPALGYDPARFLRAWPGTAPRTTLIGVEGWSGNSLTNAPAPSAYAPTLPALTVGLWPDADAYRRDVVEFGDDSASNRRVAAVRNAAASFGYDDGLPWPDPLGRASIYRRSTGSPLASTGWGVSPSSGAGASVSVATFLTTPVNATDIGSPGLVPAGTPASPGLVITELIANPASITGASNEWEWIEVYNSGPAIDFARTPYVLDDDDGADLTGANVRSGTIPSGSAAVLFNASAATLQQTRDAWERPGEAPINWIAVSDWPALANSGDAVAMWSSYSRYFSDRASGPATRTRAAAWVAYDDSAPWPTGVEGESIRLADLASDPHAAASWARARGPQADGFAYPSNEVTAATGTPDNVGGERGSPGWVNGTGSPAAPAPGDYNADGRVDAADYTVWRDRRPLSGETASPGTVDAEDLAVWRANYGRGVSGAAVAVPEGAVGASVPMLLAATRRRGIRGRC